jgi:hypothetical protein
MDQTSIVLISNLGFYHPTYGPNLPSLGSMTNPWLMMPRAYYIIHTSYVLPYPSISTKLSFPNPIPIGITMMRGNEGTKTSTVSPCTSPYQWFPYQISTTIFPTSYNECTFSEWSHWKWGTNGWREWSLNVAKLKCSFSTPIWFKYLKSGSSLGGLNNYIYRLVLKNSFKLSSLKFYA